MVPISFSRTTPNAVNMAGIKVSANISAASAYIADVTPPEKRAGSFGIIGAAFGLGFILGPMMEETLRRANAPAASHAIVLAKEPGNPHSDDHNLVTTLVLESLNPKIFSVVEVISAGKVRQVELAGANSVICASELTAGLIVQELQDPGIKDLVLDLVSDLGGHQFYVAPLAAMTDWTYAELVRWGLAHRVAVIGIRREGKDLLGCAATERLQPTDQVLLIGTERVARIDATAA